MLLVDLIDTPRSDLSEMSDVQLRESITTLCKEIDWQYDIDPLDERAFERGQKMMVEIEKQLVEMFSRDKKTAMALWEGTSPLAAPGIIPTFIFKGLS